MKYNFSLILLAALCLGLFACKKDASNGNQQQPQNKYDLENTLLSFSVNGQLQETVIDTAENTVTVVVPNSAKMNSLTATISISNQVSAKLNTTPVGSSAFSFDFTNPATLTIT